MSIDLPFTITALDQAACQAYIKKLETQEYITQLTKGEVDPEQDRPVFSEELMAIIKRIELTASRTGKPHPVKIQIETARQNSTFNAIYQGIEGKQEDTEETYNSGPICPPLPKEAVLPPEASKGACDWHDQYVAFSKKRSPRSFQGFHEANGWALLSTVAKRRVVLKDLGAPKYTPLFIAIVARSSIASKTEAARVFISVLDKAGMKWMLGPDEMTPQAMIDHMKKVDFIEAKDVPEDISELKRNLAFAGQLGWFYEEFGEHIEAICATNSIMAPFKGIIRRMDDCHDEYTRKTIAHQEQVVLDPYLSLLACMTPLDLKPYAGIDSPFWTNGFFARFAFIVPDTEEENNARFPPGDLYDAVPHGLTKPLVEWHQRLQQRIVDLIPVSEKNKKGEDNLKGYKTSYWGHPKNECEASPDAMDAFYTYGEALKSIVKEKKLEHFEGNYIRLPMLAMRIAMLCASLENDNHIEMKHWAKGQEFAEQARHGLHFLWVELNKNGFAQERARLEEEICTYIAAQQTYVSVRMLIRGKFQNHTAEELNPIMDNLISSGDLVKHPPIRGGGKYFTIPGEEDRKLPESPKKNLAGGKE